MEDLEGRHAVDSHHRDAAGDTPLIYSMRASRIDNTVLFIEAGANVNAQNDTGITALMLAAENGRKETGDGSLFHLCPTNSSLLNPSDL